MENSLLPTVKGIVVLDDEGCRVSAKYYNKTEFLSISSQIEFEAKLSKKIKGTSARNDADIIILDKNIVVFRGGADVNFCVIGSSDENELILTAVLDALYDSLSLLLRSQLDRRTLLENLALVLLAVDEVIDGGLLLETDATAIANRVLMKDAAGGAQSATGAASSVPFTELTITSALQTAKDELIKRMAN
uniref:Coatomer subunit zeta n=1 Tax=Fibrocapsa japonica TaxID=94617 RepID=A0A7S2V887_9STRA|mmetsp:Transcript_9288/g.14258  ORF Transcript_9288/g.14258 Transcript_9288/m.14258 type:complete len:191 (+) Transcript_9288:72-644(+)|eukprot:CAMPEP_0113933856 /NCGR_PEP_ID=MMETSP1339-20121228/1176_1 /TAXON_ID=94617 /ORGANISM="Fibrocapsa japonica" /LENGTH=190 /DNA_ID=CAMNT_0000935357 /DNA_START=69 /DNA_END=641 /DNA_ORIENTATION=+ /assembly_acc=CAM_ASM_000762